MSSCLTCTDPINACPTCPKGQTCIQTARSCTACAKNVCIDDGSSKSSGGGGGSSTGATAGGAVGGVLGVAAILALVYFFWWKPRGLAASRRRYSKHLSHRQSRQNEKRRTQLGGDGAVSKRTSVHLHVGEASPDGARNRHDPSGAGGRDPATGALTAGRTSEDDNPFGDQNRSSIGSFNDTGSVHTSEFSFRSSHTNVIPIAYIPPHSSSISVADGQRGAYGESGGASSGAPPSRSTAPRASIPTSMASRDSLALAGAEIIELNPLPPVLHPDTPAVPLGTTANGAPIRPPRSPGLDLQLPKSGAPLTSPITSPQSSGQSGSRPTSGFPFTAAPPSSGSPSFLSPSPTPGGRGMSVLGERHGGSHLSTITTRSGTSTMSYILDPPQIITPVNANGIRRVEFSKGQAAVVQLGVSGASSPSTSTATEVLATTVSTPSTPATSADPFDDSAAAKRHSRLDSQDTVKNSSGLDSRPVSSATDTSRWTASSLASEGSDAVQFLQGQTVTFTNPNTPASGPSTARLPNTASIASAFDVPQSARSSEAFVDTGSRTRPLTGASMSRSSTASGTSDGSHLSLLEGIPFLAAPPLPNAGASTSSVSLGLPVNVTGTVDGTPASANVAIFPSTPTQPIPPLPSSTHVSQPADSSAAPVSPFDDPSPASIAEEDDPLPAPFLPFAGQRPTSIASASGTPSAAPLKADRVQSEAFSVRSGFGSGLSQIPFQLGFPSGFGDDGASEMGDHDVDGRSDRGSIISSATRDSRFPPSASRPASAFSTAGETVDDDSRRDSYASDLGEAVVVEAVRTPVVSSPLGKASVVASSPSAPALAPLVLAPTSSPSPAAAKTASKPDDEDPFSDPRASVDSLALAAQLSASLDAEALGL
ncbi:hypothetical protein JCM8097_006997 [Rhodosporidiobolus ruineniae]